MNRESIAEIKKVGVLLNSKLTIPNYQRPYRWSEANVRLLLQDIFDGWKSGKRSYRIGSVILHKEGDDLNIVDGQQRITTILLILKVLNNKTGDFLCKKLTYDHIDSQKNIVLNHAFIRKWQNENIKNETETFGMYLTQHCEFVEIVVTDLSEAFQMFDSQNGRGKELESYNLLKAYHIRAMEAETQQERIECDRRWENATRYTKNLNDEKENAFDILRQIFNEQLYRTRLWSMKEVAYDFNKQRITEFKGITIGNHHSIEYPFQNLQLLQCIASNYFESMGLGIKGVKERFKSGESEFINPFARINQSIINGKAFFNYIETYVEIYKELFVNLNSSTLPDFKQFYKEYCLNYSGANRTGDMYLRELFKSLIFLMFDKYGEEGVNKYYKTLYSVVYRVRLEKIQVKYAAVAEYPKQLNLFSIVEQSKNYLDLQKLEKIAKAKIDCRKEVEKILEFFFIEGISVEPLDSNIKLEKYTKVMTYGNN